MEKKKKTHSRISTWFRRMFFGPGRELSFLEEEQVQSPLRSMAKRFFTNKIAMTGLIVFLSCLLLVIIGPIFCRWISLIPTRPSRMFRRRENWQRYRKL